LRDTRRAHAKRVLDRLNKAMGADANLFLYTNVTANGYYARSNTTGVRNGTDSYRGTIDFSGDRYGATAEHLLIGERFDAQTGYVRRTDFRRSSGELRFTPRPKRRALVRKFTYLGGVDYVTNARGARRDAIHDRPRRHRSARARLRLPVVDLHRRQLRCPRHLRPGHLHRSQA
jgi:hypothetical protein